MKSKLVKILSVVFLVCIFVGCFAFASSAEESYVLDGVYAFKCQVDLSSTVAESVNFSLLSKPNITCDSLGVQNGQLIYHDPDASVPYFEVAGIHSGSVVEWTEYYYQYIVFDNATVSEEFYDWFVNNAGQDYLSGRYFFNEYIVPGYYLWNTLCRFTSGDSFRLFTAMTSSPSSTGQYVVAYQSYNTIVPVYSYDNSGYVWVDEEYRDLSFENGIVPPDFYSWFVSNTTFIPSDSLLLNGTYSFPDVLPPNGAFYANIPFVYGGVEYESFNFSRGTLYFGLGAGNFDEVYNSVSGGWINKQDITFDNVVVSQDFYDNFLYLVNYVPPVVEKEISGLWRIRSNVSIPDNFILVEEVPFVSNGKSYIQFGVSNTSLGDVIAYGYFISDTTSTTDTAYVNGAWRNSAYQTIDFGSSVSVSEKFYNWFVANAFPIDNSYLLGYQEGYDVGYAEGYDIGFEYAKDVYYTENGGIIGRLLSAPGDAFDNLILYEDNGITISIWDVFTTLISASLFVWFLKMFAGG